MNDDVPTAWAEILDAEELFDVVRALGILQDAGAVTEAEAQAWRRAIVEKRGLPLPEGASA